MDIKELEKYEQLSDEEQEERIKQAVPISKAIAKAKGYPTCEFDKENGKVYFLYPDGEKVYPNSEKR